MWHQYTCGLTIGSSKDNILLVLLLEWPKYVLPKIIFMIIYDYVFSKIIYDYIVLIEYPD
jgi:hypothetical protein